MADKSARQNGASLLRYGLQRPPLYLSAKRTHRFSEEFVLEVVMNKSVKREMDEGNRWVRFGKRTHRRGFLRGSEAVNGANEGSLWRVWGEMNDTARWATAPYLSKGKWPAPYSAATVAGLWEAKGPPIRFCETNPFWGTYWGRCHRKVGSFFWARGMAKRQ